MKKRVLFFPAPTLSHIIPALYLANLLSDVYEIYCVVADEISRNIVSEQGYDTIITKSFKIGSRMEDQYVSNRKGGYSTWDMLMAIVNDELYYSRKSELSEIIDRVKPSAIFIDIFESMELIALYPEYRHIPVLFVNPMLSTYRVTGYPAVMESFWPEKEMSHAENTTDRIAVGQFFRNPILQIMKFLWGRQLQGLMRRTGLTKKHPIAKDITHTILFDGFPECIMAPLELEFSKDIQKPNQEYFGLCVTEGRQEVQADETFDDCFKFLKDRKKNGERIIYCAFGTYYKGSYQAFHGFLHTLLDALEKVEEVQVVISVNSLVIDTLRNLRRIPKFVHFFTRVPQLEVLKISNLHISHGGLGSIKESIFYGVPMLIYPLEPRWDNNGNALKIEHHVLGLMGSMQWERVSEMQAKINTLLTDDIYLMNVLRFRSEVICSNEIENLKHRLHRLISDTSNRQSTF